MSKRHTEYKCLNESRGSSKKFKSDGMNDKNFNRHVQSCKYGMKKKPNKGIGIGKYFNKNVNIATELNTCETIVVENNNESLIGGTDTLEILGEIPIEKDNADEENHIICKGFEIVMESGSISFSST